MRKVFQVCLLAIVAVLATAATASAASAPWTANPGSSYSNGVVTLDNDGTGTSYENTNLEVPVENGDTISFEYARTDVTCAGGVPRVFIQGGAYNTFDADPAGPGACGTDADNDGWFTVTGTVAGITDGFAGYTGIVNDNPVRSGHHPGAQPDHQRCRRTASDLCRPVQEGRLEGLRHDVQEPGRLRELRRLEGQEQAQGLIRSLIEPAASEAPLRRGLCSFCT